MGDQSGNLDVRVVLVHYRTPDLLERAIESWFRFYPETPVTIIDNRPDEASRETLARLCREFSRIEPFESPENLGHGPGMDVGIRSAVEEYVFCLDSDTVVERGGFLEQMVQLCSPPGVYGTGRTATINSRGFNEDRPERGFPALDPAYMLLRRETYLTLPPFIQHGQPVVENFRTAADRNLELVPFEVEEYIRHEHRGTVDRHGYGLGLKGKLNYLLNRLGL